MALGCSSSLGPATGDLSGVWVWNAVDNSLVLTLVQRGATFSGTGTSRDLVNRMALGITGDYAPPHVMLAFTFASGLACQYAATVQDSTHMVGVETCSGGGMCNLQFVKQ